MSGPWEQYASKEEGPWSQYSKPVEMTQTQKPLKIGAEGLPDAVKAVWGDFNPLSQAAVGAKAMLLDEPAMRLKQLLGGALTPDQVNEVRANRALLQDSPMALMGGIGATIGATGAPVGAAYSGLANTAARVLPSWAKFLAPSVGAAGVGGATAVTMQPVLEGESAARNFALGAGAGVAVDAATRGLSRLVQPVTQSPAVRKLLDYEIVPSPGNASGGVLKGIEDKLQSLPFVGDLIKNRNVASRDELNKAALGLGTPTGQTINSVGKEGVEQGKDAFNRAYGGVYANNQIGMDRVLAQDLRAAKNAPTIPMSSSETSQFDQIIKREVFDRLRSGQVPTDEAKQVIEANLGKAVSKAEGPLQDALKAARDSFRAAMGRSVGPAGAAELKGIDKAYSNFADIKKASLAAEGNGGVFTPRQLQRAAKPGELKSLADAAQSVLPPSIPNSGTTDRALLNWLMLSGGAMGANQYGGSAVGHEGPIVNPAYLAALAVAPALFSRAGSQYMVGDLIPGQPALAEALRQLSPYGAQAGALYGTGR